VTTNHEDPRRARRPTKGTKTKGTKIHDGTKGEAAGTVSSAEASNKEVVMERDVICGMQVDPAKAAGKSDYNGKTYYFCSNACKTKFDADPGKYAK
jgi:YHS domain-containing protein